MQFTCSNRTSPG